MAITGISAISGEQIIAAGAVSAREAASASFTTGGDSLQGLYDTVSNNSASWTGGGIPSAMTASAVEFVVNGGSATTTAFSAMSGLPFMAHYLYPSGVYQQYADNTFAYCPTKSLWSGTGPGAYSGIYSPLQYATGACLAMRGNKAANDVFTYGALYKGNEWFISDRASLSNVVQGAVRAEAHRSRGIHISGSHENGNGFDLKIDNAGTHKPHLDLISAGVATGTVDIPSIQKWNEAGNAYNSFAQTNSYDNPGWETVGITTGNPLGFKINPSVAYDDVLIVGSRLITRQINGIYYELDLSIAFSGNPKSQYGYYNNFATLDSGHFACPFTAQSQDDWNNVGGNMSYVGIWGNEAHYTTFDPYNKTATQVINLKTMVFNS